MQTRPYSPIITVGLAIFSMLFGAGNLIYPLKVGMFSGTNTVYGMVGFILTGVCLPLLGLVAMILFDGNYELFFRRLGKTVGDIIIFACMIIIGPGLVIPRLVTLSHTMIAPFLPFSFLQTVTLQSSFVFALLFLGITFLATFRENRVVNLLGKVISPLLLLSLLIIIVKGMLTAQLPILSGITPWESFRISLMIGYGTLDLLGAIFFSAMVIHILKNTMGGTVGFSQKKLALLGLKSGALGVFLLALVYVGMSILSVYHGHSLDATTGDLFRALAFRVLGLQGALIIGTAVLMACFSTAIALGAVIADYFRLTLFNRRIGYEQALLLSLLLCVPLSTFGLDYVLALTEGPLVRVGYPVIIAITLCNLAYKLFGFKPIKMLVAITFLVTLGSYIW